MKIYVTNINPSTIKPVLNSGKLDKYILNQNGYKKYELNSEDFGTHIIDYSKNNVENMYRIEPTLNMDLHFIKDYKDLPTLLVDQTNYVYIPVVSQFPVNYVLTKMTCFEYVLNKKSAVKLVVECLLENNNDLLSASFGSSLNKEFIPINFYFTSSSSSSSDKIDDNLLEEINVFLLELN